MTLFFHKQNLDIHKSPITPVNYPKEFTKNKMFENSLKKFEIRAYTKYNKWSYEKEHRIITSETTINFEKKCLVEINLGCKCDIESDEVINLLSIIKESNYPNVKIIQTKQSFDNYELIFEEIEI